MSKTRKILIFLGSLFVIYLLAGFFLFPFLLHHFAQKALREHLDPQASIVAVKANPFKMELRVEGLSASHPEGIWRVDLDSALMNISALSLIKFYPVFDEIHLKKPQLNLIRKAVSAEKNSEPANNSEAKDWRALVDTINTYEIPKFRIDLFEVSQGITDFKDDTNATTYSQRIEPISFLLKDLRTVADGENTIRFLAKTQSGSELEWNSYLTTAPLTAEGSLRLKQVSIAELSPYFAKFIRFDLEQAILGINLDYQLNLGDLDNLLHIHSGEILLDDLLFDSIDGDGPIISIRSIEVKDLNYSFPQMALEVGSLVVSDGATKIRREQDGRLNLLELFVLPEPTIQEETGSTATQENTEQKTFTGKIDLIELVNHTIIWEDNLAAGLATVEVGVPNLRIEHFWSDLKKPFTVTADYSIGGTGSAHLEGAITPANASVDLTLEIDNLPLTSASAYSKHYAEADIKNGTLDFSGKIKSVSESTYELTGDLNIISFLIHTNSPHPLMAAWDELNVSEITLQTEPLSARIATVEVINPKGSLAYTSPEGPKEAPQKTDVSNQPEPETPEAQVEVSVDTLIIKDGGFTIKDQSLSPATEMEFSDTHISITSINTVSEEPATIDLKSTLNGSQLSLNGSLHPIEINKETNFRFAMDSLPMPSLSPYSGKALGRTIDKGWFSLDADWSIKDSQLKANNQIVIDELNLGSKVESETALVLPLDLAITLLKGPSGVMDLSLPLTGDLSDPKLGLGQIIRTAFVGLITNIAASPFKLLSGLVENDVDLSHVEFSPGQGDLDSESVDRLNALANALKQRPELKLTMQPIISDEDRQYLLERQLREELLAGSDKKDDESYQNALRKQYATVFKNTSNPDLPEKPEEAQQQMKDALLAQMQLDKSSVSALAEARISSIRKHLLQAQGLAPERLALLPEGKSSVTGLDTPAEETQTGSSKPAKPIVRFDLQ